MSLVGKDLRELTKIVFSKKYEYLEGEQKFTGKSGKVWIFDAVIKANERGNFGIFIRDWKREISVTQLRQLYKSCRDVPEIQGGIMVCNTLSDFARDYSSEFGIKLLSKVSLLTFLKNN